MTPFIHLILLAFLLKFHIANSSSSSSSSSSWVETQTTQTQSRTLTKLHFYYHDVVRGPEKSVTVIAKPENSTLFDFGTLVMIDEPLTLGLDRRSKLVGRAQGMYGIASPSRQSLIMTMTLIFMEGRFNGSSISVMGRYNVDDEVRELAIVGGTGVFRVASGYLVAKRTKFSGIGDENTAEFNVFVMHYDASNLW